MTVVALLFAETFPISISDVLISSKNGEKTNIWSPIETIRTRDTKYEDNPVGLAKKQLKDDSGYFLYAGIVKDALEVFDNISNRNSYADYDEEAHNGIVEIIKYKNLDVSFIFVTVLSDGFIHHYYHNASIFTGRSKRFGKVIIIGSGKETFAKKLTQIENLESEQLPIFPTLNPLGDFVKEGVTYINQAVKNLLHLLSQCYLDCIGNDSEFDYHSCGGFFDVNFFTDIDIIDSQAKWLLNGICHVDVHLSSSGFADFKVIWGTRTKGELEVLVGKAKLTLECFDKGFFLDEISLLKVGKTRTETSKESLNLIKGWPSSCYLVIAYISKEGVSFKSGSKLMSLYSSNYSPSLQLFENKNVCLDNELIKRIIEIGAL